VSRSCSSLTCRPGVWTHPRTLSPRSGQDTGNLYGARTLSFSSLMCFCQCCVAAHVWIVPPVFLPADQAFGLLRGLCGLALVRTLGTCTVLACLSYCCMLLFQCLVCARCLVQHMCGMCRVLHASDVSDWTGVPGIPVRRAWGRFVECRRGTWMVVP